MIKWTVGMRQAWLGCMMLMASLLWMSESEAGLFCSVDNLTGRQCQFSDLESCRRAVGKQGGCVLNETELAKPFGAAPYCLVESWRTECVYFDMASCERRATSTKTVCMANPDRSGMGGMPVAGQPPQTGMPAMPGMPGRNSAFQGGLVPPTSGGVGATYPPNAGYWPGL